MKPTPPPGQTVRRRPVTRSFGKVVAWIVGIPAALVLVFYAVVLIHPIPLPFMAAQVRNMVVAAMPAGTELELGDMALAVENFVQPVIQFTPVTYRDTTTGAKVRMDALEVGFSLIHAVFGQPGATVTVVGPHIQVNQDIFGPRLADFEVVPDPSGGPATVRVLEGSTAFPDAGFHKGGIDVNGNVTDATRVRSDNAWLVYNVEAANKSIASVLEQAQMGRFSRLSIKKGVVDMNDAIYGVFRTFTDMTLDIAPTTDGKAVKGSFSAKYAGTTMHANIERLIDADGDASLKIDMSDFVLGSFAPNIDDSASLIGIVGPSAVSVDLRFDTQSGAIKGGDFHVDMTGTELRIGKDFFPIASSILEVTWMPATGTFSLAESAISVGPTSAKVGGVFVLGLDDLYGPTAAISMTMSDVSIRPGNLPPPTEPFESISFKGWEAPLYGAIGIDQAIITKKNGARIESKGRIDMLRKGMGFDMSIAGQNITADDMKRIWPYFIATSARDWFMKSVVDGKIESATMKYAFPAGTIGLNGDDKPIPQNGVFIEMVADGVKINATDTLPIDIQGKTRMQMHDSEFTLSGENGVIPTAKGNIEIANAALVMTPADTPGEQLVEISGDMNGGIPALAAIAGQFVPALADAKDLPVDLGALGGDLNVRLLSTVTLDKAGATKNMNYSITGNVQDFGSTAPIQGHLLNNGQLSFMATQDGFRIGGQASLDGMGAEVVVGGDLKANTPSNLSINASVDLADLGKMGFDVSQFGSGKVTLSAKPADDGSIGVTVDLKAANLNIKDLGIVKPAGTPGKLAATIRQKGDTTDISDLDLAFGTVKLKGGLEFDAKKGLQSAEFTSFALSPGDAAQISLTPIKDGYSVRVRGDQLDLKPMFKRFLSLDGGGAAATPPADAPAFTQAIAVDAQLKRAIGFYKTNAYNLDLDLAMKGTDLKKVTLTAQLGGTSSISVATNPAPDGKTMTVVFNDLGSLLRLVGVYPQLDGGSGSFVMHSNATTNVDEGQVRLKNFAIVDEKHIAEILDTHAESRQLLGRSNNLAFTSAQIDFTKKGDRISLDNAVVSGQRVGGTAQGYIYTDTKQYDIVGTYIPMFGINNAFGRLFGPLGGGKNGGLFGITFQVKGDLASPQFKVNPMSALAPGAFRSLFEYRAKETPRAGADE